MKPKYGSLFSGVGGFDLGFDEAGWECAWQVEQEPFCNAVLATHWPHVKRFKDVLAVGKRNLEKVDCITAGVPCQDVSIAGKRAGLAGKRTGLFFEFARILQELRPTWFVFENVPGLFSSNNGRDFAEVLRVFMVECGYGVSWRVLDSRYFNVAQRRERVFLVGHLGKPCPPEILFECASGQRDIETSGAPRQDIAVPLTAGSGDSRPGRRMEDDFNIVASTLQGGGKSGQSEPGSGLIASALTAECSEKAYRGDGSENIFAIAENQRGEIRTSAIAPQLSTGGGKPGSGYPAVAYALREDPGGTGQAHNCTYIVDEERSSQQQQQQGKVDGAMQRDADDGTAPNSQRVRTFAGLPKGMDSPRYRALGNAVTKTVSRWIAERLIAAHENHS